MKPLYRWALLVVLAVVAGGCGKIPQIPPIDTSKLDAIARRTLDQQITEVKAHPKSGSAWGQLGTMLRAFGFPPQALACFAKAEELDPKNPRWPYFQSLLLTSESPDRAIDSLRRAVRLCGSEPEMPRLRLSKLLAEQGRWDEAEIELRQLLAAKPGFTPATLLLARRAQAGGNDSDAISLARRCTEDRRTARGAWSLLAILYGRAGDTAAASEATRNATALPEDTSPADAFETEASRLRRNPRELAIGTHDLLAAGRLDEAASNIDQITKEHPEFAEGWLLLGRLQILRNQAPAAEQSLRHFLQMEPRSTQGLFQFGTALLQQNRFPEAAEIFLKATEIQPDFGPAYFNRGFALARAGQSREAVPNFQQAIRHNPEHIESYLLLADLHRQLGEREQGLAVLSSGLAINPSDRRLQQLRALMSK